MEINRKTGFVRVKSVRVKKLLRWIEEAWELVDWERMI